MNEVGAAVRGGERVAGSIGNAPNIDPIDAALNRVIEKWDIWGESRPLPGHDSESVA
jgi:hypothetical protein